MAPLTVKKLLSENPARYRDAALQGIREILGLKPDAPIPPERVSAVKNGNHGRNQRPASNAGANAPRWSSTGDFATCSGSAARTARTCSPGTSSCRDSSTNESSKPLQDFPPPVRNLPRWIADAVKRELKKAFAAGIRTAAIVLIHACYYPQHELKLAELAKECGFTHVSVSHQVSSLVKLVSPGRHHRGRRLSLPETPALRRSGQKRIFPTPPTAPGCFSCSRWADSPTPTVSGVKTAFCPVRRAGSSAASRSAAAPDSNRIITF